MNRKNPVVFAIVMIAVATTLAACQTRLEKYAPIISEVRDVAYEGVAGAYSVDIVSGTHEQPFKADGKSEPKTAFTVITLTPKTFVPNAVYTFTLIADETEHTGALSVHPFGESYSSELPVRIYPDTQVNLTVRHGGKSETVELKPVNENDDLTADRALEIAMTALKTPLDGLKTDGVYACEIYVRFIKNPINADGGYYWYVAIIAPDARTYAALLDRKSGAIVGIKD